MRSLIGELDSGKEPYAQSTKTWISAIELIAINNGEEKRFEALSVYESGMRTIEERNEAKHKNWAMRYGKNTKGAEHTCGDCSWITGVLDDNAGVVTDVCCEISYRQEDDIEGWHPVATKECGHHRAFRVLRDEVRRLRVFY